MATGDPRDVTGIIIDDYIERQAQAMEVFTNRIADLAADSAIIGSRVSDSDQYVVTTDGQGLGRYQDSGIDLNDLVSKVESLTKEVKELRSIVDSLDIYLMAKE